MSKNQQHLVYKVQAGDEYAFKELFFCYYEILCNYAVKFTNSEYLAEEIVQEVFTIIWECRQDWQPDNVKAWLFTTTHNKALDHVRHRQVREKNSSHVQNIYDSQELETPEQSIQSKYFREAAQHAIANLPPRCRDTYILHRQEEFSYSEIAEIMGVSLKTVETQMSRALKLLREQLKDYLPLLSLFMLL